MNRIIDFDNEFRHYIEYLISNEENDSVETMEENMANIYEKWMDTPATWLDGVKPKDYFKQIEDANDLVKMVIKYLKVGVGVPDLLFDRISQIGQDATNPLIKLFKLEYEMADVNLNEAQMIAVNLLAEIGDEELHEEYVYKLADEMLNEELAIHLIERLEFTDAKIVDIVFEELDKSESIVVQKRFADVLVNFENDKRVLNHLIMMFNKTNTDTALLASYLGKYNDDAAIPILKEALDWEEINYLDYSEIKAALEKLGVDIEHTRNFDGDQYFESLKNI